MRPYIGVTGVKTPDEHNTLTQHFGTPEHLRLHIGGMSGRKKLLGLESKYNPGFLDAHELARVFPSATASTMNCLHYADYGQGSGETPAQETTGVLGGAMACCGTNLQAVQLDMILPNPEAINPLMKSFRPHGVEWILQINPQTLERIPNLNDLADYLKSYAHLDYVLVDFSIGTGKAMDREKVAELAAFFAQFYQVAVAGGLGPNTLDLLGPLTGKYSIDAQGKLLAEGSDRFNPVLDLEAAKSYLQRAKTLFPKG
jgi:hypothetical protein